MLIVVQCSCPSTVEHADPAAVLVEVKVVFAWPDVMVPLADERITLVALKVTPTGGTLGGGVSVALAEFCVMSAVTVEVAPGVVGFGDALVVSLIHGLPSRLAAPVPPSPFGVPVQPEPTPPGPKLQPHQLFSRLIGDSEPL